MNIRAAIPILISAFLCSFCNRSKEPEVITRNYTFTGNISQAVLSNYLERAVTMSELCVSPGLMQDGSIDYLEDDLRLIQNTGAKFIGRAIYRWGQEEALNNPDFLSFAGTVIDRIHALDPDVVVQAAIFEIITDHVEQVPVPAYVFEAYGLPVEARNFVYDSMLYRSGKYRDHWGPGKSVPDITRTETQLWFYYLASQYMDAGIEAIHWGQIALMGEKDAGLSAWFSLLTRIREYAKETARRKFVLNDAHAPRGGFRVNDRLLMDFHSFPMRITESGTGYKEGKLMAGYLDAIYRKSLGGITPSGWSCQHLPYLVEFDNFGISNYPGEAGFLDIFIWGYDEISWFSLKTPEAQRDWLQYAFNWLKQNDPDGHLQMPVTRVVTIGTGPNYKYKANFQSPACPPGTDLEMKIRELWQ